MQYNQMVRLKRRYGVCPTCGAGFFPLDEELELLAGSLTPSLFVDYHRPDAVRILDFPQAGEQRLITLAIGRARFAPVGKNANAKP